MVRKWIFTVGAMDGLWSVTTIIVIYCQKHESASHGKKLPKNGTKGQVNDMAEYIEWKALLAEYDREHKGEPGNARKLIKEAPTADVAEVVHGQWEEWWPPKHMILTGEEMLYRCSACDAKYSDKENMRYCPNCGAKMDLEVTAND